MNWVADCSMAMAWSFKDEATPRTQALLNRTEDDPFVVPLHWPLEVTNVLRNAVKRGRLTEAQSVERASALASLSLRYDLLTHQVAFTSIYQMAQKYKLTTYDAAYLELALRRGIPLATQDGKLKAAASVVGVHAFAP